MLSFLKYVLATIVGLMLFIILALFIVGGIAATAGGETVEVKDGSVLRLKLDKPLLERAPEDPFEGLNVPLFAQQEGIGLYDLRRTLRNAAVDDRIRGLYLDVAVVQGGYAQIEELRNDLMEFKESGKFIVTYGEFYTEGAYLLASVADEIMLNPEGVMEFNGLYVEPTFIKGTLEKLGVVPYVIRAGTYKSAGETFTEKELSPNNREQITSFITSIYERYLSLVSEGRGKTPAQLRAVAEEGGLPFPDEAARKGLITKVGYYDEMLTLLRERLELEADEEVEFIAYERYRKAAPVQVVSKSQNRVAVLFASGNIVSGEGSETVIGADQIARELRKLRDDDRVKAVVLRINSGGGSAIASDVMWRAIQLTREEKPVIASMSTVAASGGYYMAMACDTIVAQPTTLTGSIGVFSLLFNAQELLNEKLGVTTGMVKTAPFADLGLPTSELTDAERAILQRRTDAVYETFLTKVARGRDLPLDSVRTLAEGRVWTGQEAIDRGLVDVLGGLDDAVALAAAAAGLDEDDYRIRPLPEQKNFLEQLTDEGEEQYRMWAMERRFGIWAPLVQQIEEIGEMQGPQARIPFDFEVR
ncbi:MAG: signal peptide peptidase SppA [Catalinimonas sp.]